MELFQMLLHAQYAVYIPHSDRSSECFISIDAMAKKITQERMKSANFAARKNLFLVENIVAFGQ